MNYLADNKSLLDLTIQCTPIGLPLISHLPSTVPQSLCPNVKLKPVVMPSLPDTETSELPLSNINSKNKNPMVITQWLKLLVILLLNKDNVVTSSPIMVMMSMMKTGKLSFSPITPMLSLKLQSPWLKCKPLMVETPPVLE